MLYQFTVRAVIAVVIIASLIDNNFLEIRSGESMLSDAGGGGGGQRDKGGSRRVD